MAQPSDYKVGEGKVERRCEDGHNYVANQDGCWNCAKCLDNWGSLLCNADSSAPPDPCCMGREHPDHRIRAAFLMLHRWQKQYRVDPLGKCELWERGTPIANCWDSTPEVMCEFEKAAEYERLRT